jgi:hypothetical protein
MCNQYGHSSSSPPTPLIITATSLVLPYLCHRLMQCTLLSYMLQCCHNSNHKFVTMLRSHSVISYINQKHYSSLLTLVNTLSSPSLSHRSTTMHITSFPVISSTLFRHSTTIQAISETKTQAQRHNNLQTYAYFNKKAFIHFISFLTLTRHKYHYLH